MDISKFTLLKIVINLQTPFVPQNLSPHLRVESLGQEAAAHAIIQSPLWLVNEIQSQYPLQYFTITHVIHSIAQVFQGHIMSFVVVSFDCTLYHTLQMAAYGGNDPILALLVENSANPNLQVIQTYELILHNHDVIVMRCIIWAFTVSIIPNSF